MLLLKKKVKRKRTWKHLLERVPFCSSLLSQHRSHRCGQHSPEQDPHWSKEWIFAVNNFVKMQTMILISIGWCNIPEDENDGSDNFNGEPHEVSSANDLEDGEGDTGENENAEFDLRSVLLKRFLTWRWGRLWGEGWQGQSPQRQVPCCEPAVSQ